MYILKTTFTLLFCALPFLTHAAQSCNSAIPRSAPDSRYIDHGDRTVTDSETGLMWKQCSEGLSDSGCVSGAIETFNWQEAMARAESINSGAGFAGYTDWRVPDIKELASLVEIACYSPAINETLFPATPASGFWSASPHALSSDYAWVVLFSNGGDNDDVKSYGLRLRLVRAGQ